MGSVPIQPFTPAGTLVSSGQLQGIEAVCAFLLNPPRCSLVQNNVQSLAANVRTAITWDSETYDTDGMHSTTSNTSRITCQTPGLYTVSYEVSILDATGGQDLRSFLMLNGGYFPGATDDQESYANTYTTLHACTDIQLSVGDYIEVHAEPSAAVSTKGQFLSDATVITARWVAKS